MKNIFSSNQGSSYYLNNKTTVFYLLKLTSIFILSLAYASPVNAFLRVSVETIAFPSESPLAKKNDIYFFESIKKMQKAGLAGEVKELSLAYQQKNAAWETGKTILGNIRRGHVNEKNILNYVSPDEKSEFAAHLQQVMLVIKKIQSFGNLTELSTSNTKTFIDRMLIKKEYGHDVISTRVIDFIYPPVRGKIKKRPFSFITVTLIAKPPYQQWFLSGIKINDSFFYLNHPHDPKIHN